MTALPLFRLCRVAGDETQFCPFAGNPCHESRQRIQHYEGLRGNMCWFYQKIAPNTMVTTDPAGDFHA